MIAVIAVCTRGVAEGVGGEGAYMNVPPQRIWFLGHFGLESGIVFELRIRNAFEEFFVYTLIQVIMMA